MVLSGRKILEKHLVSFPDDLMDNERVVQPNGIDLRVCKVESVVGKPRLPRDNSIQTDDLQINDIALKNGWFELPNQQGNYLVQFRETISVQDGLCAIIVPRSSVLRTGIFITSALWDTGFQGPLGASMRVRNPIDIQYGATLAQVMFFQAEFAGQRYSGRYQGTSQSEMLKVN